jgi:hypothetical protein
MMASRSDLEKQQVFFSVDFLSFFSALLSHAAVASKDAVANLEMQSHENAKVVNGQIVEARVDQISIVLIEQHHCHCVERIHCFGIGLKQEDVTRKKEKAGRKSQTSNSAITSFV